jgi:hypothetical protein
MNDLYLIIVFCAVMSTVMGCAVVLDNIDDQERGGVFMFKHKWANLLCRPMLLIIPTLLFFWVMLVPLNIYGIIENVIARAGLFILISMGLEFIFFLAVAICLWLKFDFITKDNLSLG